MIVSVLNTKGGVGKTTVAMLLAEALRRSHGSVEVWDADAQGSATDWADNARENGDPLSFSVEPVSNPRLKRQTPKADHVVIDTPPHDPECLALAAARSDFAVIPTSASPMDMKRTAATLQTIGVPFGMLFCKVNVRTVLYRKALEWAQNEGVSAFDTVIGDWEGAKQIVDSNLTDMNLLGIESVADELMQALTEG